MRLAEVEVGHPIAQPEAIVTNAISNLSPTQGPPSKPGLESPNSSSCERTNERDLQLDLAVAGVG
jgi:hypothetical protein